MRPDPAQQAGGSRCKVYVTDEGLGPLVRESAIMDALLELDGDLSFSVQTLQESARAEQLMPGASIIKRFNNIRWQKTPLGSPDHEGIRAFYSDYPARARAFVEQESSEFDYDFVLSDFVHEAFEVASRRSVPAFGVCHFTWDWFLSKLYPPPVTRELLSALAAWADKADAIYLPPFTPEEVVLRYKRNSVQVPFVVRQPSPVPALPATGRFKVLLMDSGAKVLQHYLEEAVGQLKDLTDFDFLVSSDFGVDLPHVYSLPSDTLMLDYFPQVDLVICRAGFNTISECIATRTPMLLLGESLNPEMEVNMLTVKRHGLGSFIDVRALAAGFGQALQKFVDHEYQGVSRAMDSHEWPCDGAGVIAADILERVSR